MLLKAAACLETDCGRGTNVPGVYALFFFAFLSSPFILVYPILVVV